MRKMFTNLAAATAVVVASLGVAAPAMADTSGGQGSRYAYPELGQTLDATSLVSAVAAHAGTNMTRPDGDLYPKKSMDESTANNVGNSMPDAFEGTKGVKAWFGKPDALADKMGCSPVQEVLKRDLVDVRVGAGGCTVESGTLYDALTGSELPVAYHAADAEPLVKVVNIVGPEYAYAHGGFTMDPDTRVKMMNDPLNMVAVPSRLVGNESSPGDGMFTTPVQGSGIYDPEGARAYLPSDKTVQQQYAARFVAVMMKYGITMEKKSLPHLTSVMQGWTGKLDTSAAGLEKLATTPTHELRPGLAPAQTSAPSASASAPAQGQSPTTDTTASPTHEGREQKSKSLSPLMLGLGALIGLVAVGSIAVAYFRRDVDRRG